ncbi:HEPN domain-containing protein [Chloracidobacterium thermophilum]|uniref:HEPN domain-containing protein n=1 Tax=Chloracidobacterium thermophilum TaxID=458033 RepID=UPI0007385A09|nr:HEPN domain-containing protein [Chloracidobacterium thermophilum]
MRPHLEEAWRLLRLAERDIKAFEVLKEAPDVHPSITYFHAQQAVEKSLKAVLFLQQIEFERTHDLVKLARLLQNCGVTLPVTESQLRRLNPFAVAFRYDDLEITLVSDDDLASVVAQMRHWAKEQISAATECEESDGPDNH